MNNMLAAANVSINFIKLIFSWPFSSQNVEIEETHIPHALCRFEETNDLPVWGNQTNDFILYVLTGKYLIYFKYVNFYLGNANLSEFATTSK